MDKRIIKTRTCIKQAFMKLMENNELSDLSISDVAREADVNRSTFYLHYKSLADVVIDIEDEISTSIGELIKEFDVTCFDESIDRFLHDLTHLLDENPTLCRYLLYSTNSKSLISRIKEIFIEKISKAIASSDTVSCSETIVYPLTFVTGGLIDTFIQWFNTKNKTISLETLAHLIGKNINALIENDLFTR